MSDQYSFDNIDRLLFQFALQTQELSQKKNEINQQIEVCRADIAERTTYVETIHKNIKNLEEEIRVKQSSVIRNKANAKSMKATNSLLLQYEQSLRAELESRKARYNHDTEAYDERIAGYWTTFHSHKEYHHQNPLAQKLLTLQAENEEIECRIKACDDQITMKQKELDRLTGPAVDSSSTEKLPDSVSGQQPIAGQEEQLDPQTEEESNSSIDISSLHLNQTQNDQKTSVEAEEIQEENKVQYATACSPSPEEEESNEQWADHLLDEQVQADEMQIDEQETGQEDQEVLPTPVSEDEVEEKAAADDEQAQSEEDNEGLATFAQSSSQETNPHSSPAKMSTVPSTPTFPFNFSPTSSPCQGTSDIKSPAFQLFSVTSGASTPGFSGFGFDVGSGQDEESSFAFAGPLFNEKKSTEPQSSTCPEFLFGQPEQSGDFQFAFASKSPQTSEENTRDDFPFSFSF